MGEKLFFKKVFHHHKASFAQQNEPNTTSFAQQNEPNPKQVLRSKTSPIPNKFCAAKRVPQKKQVPKRTCFFVQSFRKTENASTSERDHSVGAAGFFSGEHHEVALESLISS